VRRFRHRSEAGLLLGERLATLPLERPVVVGLARGGVVVAAGVARALGAPLDALAVRKVRHPLQPELGVGAVTPGGGIWLRESGLDAATVQQAVRQARAEAEQLDRRLHESIPPIDVGGRDCVLVDDGLATGGTMLAAVDWARTRGAQRVICAAPVGVPATVRMIETVADAVLCFLQPEDLVAVGEWYEDFRPTAEEEVIRLLKRERHIAEPVDVPIGSSGLELAGTLTMVDDPIGVVAFAHGSGSSRHSPRNRMVARVLNDHGFVTLLCDLLTEAEASDRAKVFDIDLLADRLKAATRWVRASAETAVLPVGYFGASTGAGAALIAAADLGEEIRAVVSRGGRSDLALDRLAEVTAPTLLLVGANDPEVARLNRLALGNLRTAEMIIVPGASHLFEEPGTLEQVADHAVKWFRKHLPR
jgi:predicted phosphoribosyltransferase/pimeloyl-ACP methyl ester carboxylesterase